MTEDEKLQQALKSENPVMRACIGIVRGARLIEPFEPEMAAEISARFHQFADQQTEFVKSRDLNGYRNGLVGLRDSLGVIAAIVHAHKIDDARITTGQLIDGFFNLMEELETWGNPFGLKPFREKGN